MLIFHQLWLRTEDHMWVSIIVPGGVGVLVNRSQFTHHAAAAAAESPIPSSSWEGWGESTITLEWFRTFIHWFGPRFFLSCMLSNSSEWLTQGPYQKTPCQQWGLNLWSTDDKSATTWAIQPPPHPIDNNIINGQSVRYTKSILSVSLESL